MIENGRIVKNRYKQEDFLLFIKKIKALSGFKLKAYKPPTDSTLQERYSFDYNRHHVSIVYETNSLTLVITALNEVLDILRPMLESDEIALPQSNNGKLQAIKPINSDIRPDAELAAEPINTAAKPINIATKSINTAAKPINTAAKPQNSTTKSINIATKSQNSTTKPINTAAKSSNNSPANSINNPPSESIPKSLANQKQSPAAKTETKTKNTKSAKLEINPKQKQEQLKQEQQKQVEENKKLDELYKNGFAIKKYQPLQLENVIKNIKALKGVTIKQTLSEKNSHTYLICDKKNKVYLRFIQQKCSLQLQGKRSKLFGEIQLLVIEGSDYETAVSSHIDLTGEEKRAKDMEKRLKKLLPNAFDFLSEQSRIDITIGMIDISNDEVKLSDYSMLLVPPYRGLERLIYDLQKRKGIEVKMIGQAYEKLDGVYTLKLGYRRKINSIVYSEVMSALYTEYFAKRNFYAHSDITGDLLSRVITEKSAVKEIFNRFLQIIEYNIIKLKEINFK